MSASALVEAFWLDDTYSFKLGIAELEQLDEKLDLGPLGLLRRFEHELWRIADLRETLRWGLIGGGATPMEADKIVRRNLKEAYLMQALTVAFTVVGASISGVADDQPDAPPGEPEAPTTETSEDE